MKRLNELKDRYEVVGDVRGLGLMLAIDFVRDRKTKRFNEKFRYKVIERAFRKGLLLLSTGRSAIRLIPPLTITESEIDEGLDILEDSIRKSE
jgi:4-aminobutyrate aminotransferase